MPGGKARPKPIATTYFSLESPEDMTACLKAMLKEGYVGAIGAHVEDGKELWGLQLHSPTQPEVRAELLEVLLWDETELRKIPLDEFRRTFET